LTFLPNPKGLPKAGHKDLNPLNNDLSNLEWCLHQKTMDRSAALYGATENKPRRRKRNTAFVLTDDQVREIRGRYEEGDITYRELAEEYRVHISSIDRVINHRGWKWVK
jgi:hypothetical protein